MEKLYISNWFKLPPKNKLNKNVKVKIVKKGTGKKYGQSRKKIKK